MDIKTHSETAHRETATIYQFPTSRIRSTAAERERAAMSDEVSAALDNCWYHSDAIRQAALPNS